MFFFFGAAISLGYIKSNIYDPVYVAPKLE
jgi:hypothetical protein